MKLQGWLEGCQNIPAEIIEDEYWTQQKKETEFKKLYKESQRIALLIGVDVTFPRKFGDSHDKLKSIRTSKISPKKY